MKGLFSRALSVLVVKIIFVIIGFLTTLTLAKLYSADQLGDYFWLLSCITLMCVVMRFGQENMLIKLIVQSAKRTEKQIISTQAMAIVLVTAIVVLLINLFVNLLTASTLGISNLILVNAMFFALISIIGYSMQAVGNSVIQQFLLNIPRLLSALLAIVLFWLFNELVSLDLIVTFTFFIGLLFGLLMFYLKGFRLTPSPVKLLTNKTQTYHYLWISFSAVLMAEAAIVLLGVYGNAKEVAYFGIATRLVSLIAFVLLAFNSVTTPKFAALFKQGKHSELISYYQSSRRQSMFISSFFAVFFWASGEFLLSQFGEQYQQASEVLLVLLLTQLIKVFVGAAGQLLMMADRVTLQKYCITAGVCTLLVSCYILIPLFGALGAAFATLIATAVNNFLALFYVNRYLAIPLSLANPR
ncbi:hypothetical protein PSECIP111854_01860 [Pseudoalteromonas sp. CIP111854]|uniref:Polysaccharide biosynthesis protein C-terminal domain-containing protein n=1 Tax=Pseudoalteromonas holothuriae TaxID=2963714 RepID=A0A9W4QWG6_9GAMM|nr:polysaccharide biosynthesis C-terminal domain-containing protein [Pseudoalteromonas sp. CIP111854]CAH9056770.1 hypothetical protein PSECIP111854_01860 [Pseudoalteromonas sp. CIP111854]